MQRIVYCAVCFSAAVTVIRETAPAVELACTKNGSKAVNVLLDAVSVYAPVEHDCSVVQFTPSPNLTMAVPVVLAVQ